MDARNTLVTLAVSALSLCAFTVSAQENRQYWYNAIDTRIEVNADSTLSVEERQNYRYEGEYHKGWRSIALKDISYISEVEVYDGATGKKLQWSSSRLDKTNPNSWGHYTTYKGNGAQVIEWYYNLRDTSHIWVLRYTVHGAITFGTQFDRLYYNLFTDYDVPVESAIATIVLPQGLSNRDALYAYRDGVNKSLINKSVEQRGAYDVYTVSGALFDPGADFTIDLSWQKGYVLQSAFWKDWLAHNYGYVLGSLIVLFSILYWIVYFVRTEVLPKGRGTIIPQYEPPRGLRPALAELLIKEGVSRRTWPATIVDLAVRGYVEIKEEKGRTIVKNISLLIIVIALAVLAIASFNPFYFVMFVVVAIYFFKTGLKYSSQYEVKGIKPYETDMQLESYEQSFLKTLFSLNDENVFRTKDLTSMHFNTAKYVQFGEDMQKLPQVLKDRAGQEAWFAVDFKKEGKGQGIGWFLVSAAIVLTIYFWNSDFVQIAEIVSSVLILCAAIFFLAPSEARLSQEGRELREEWLGFKLYLETAERYRLQNLTPDLFEKFLPYAIVFGIEKKWAKAFEGMQVPPPSWYHGALVAGSMGDGVSGAGFSASAFSSSFSSSFASAFSSSAGSGASGGGGAGGGGGGGGGGAS